MAPFPPVEPPSTLVRFADPRSADAREIFGVGRDFRPGTLLSAYRAGIFPWPQPGGWVPWCSPDPRAIGPLETAPTWSRSLRRALRCQRYDITLDTAFRSVMVACGEGRDDGTWITPDVVDGYCALHDLGWAHSLEVWETLDGGRTLVAGIYGIAIGAYFAGESMFHRRTDASKIAFAELVARLRRAGFVLFDVQAESDHLASLGCISISRQSFLDRLDSALGAPHVAWEL